MSESELQQLEELAKLPSFTIKKISQVLNVDEDWLREQISAGCEIADAYNRGRLAADVEFNKKVQLLSNQGSGPAQTLVDKMKKDAEYQELRNYYK